MNILRKTEKIRRAEQLRELVEEVNGAILAGYRGLKVEELSDVRKRVREAGGRLQVVKNSLFVRAVEGTHLEPLAEKVDGPMAVAFISDDMGPVAKALNDYGQSNELLVIHAVCLEGKLLEPSVAIALPSRIEAITGLVWCLEAPIHGLANGLGNMISRLVWALSEVEEQKTQAA